MNGAHDLGGQHGFDPINPDPNEPVFHAEWEKRAFAITLAMGAHGAWNLDMSRYARERMEPGAYLSTSYYEHWIYGLQSLLIEKGFLAQDEIDARMRTLNEQKDADAQG